MEYREALKQLKSETPLEQQVEPRVEFLKDKITEAIQEIWELTTLHAEDVRNGRELEERMTRERLDKMIHNANKYLHEIWHQKERLMDKEPTDDDEMLELARLYPFESLIEFKHGRACCPFHNGDNPTALALLSGNKVKCFTGCGGRIYDTIDYVMHVEGLDFRSAVRRLNGL